MHVSLELYLIAILSLAIAKIASILESAIPGLLKMRRKTAANPLEFNERQHRYYCFHLLPCFRRLETLISTADWLALGQMGCFDPDYVLGQSRLT